MPAIQPQQPQIPGAGIAPLSSMGAGSGNPILDEIDQAHASLSPPAKAAIEQAHTLTGIKPADTSAGIEASAPVPALGMENPIQPVGAPGVLPPVGASPTPQSGPSPLTPSLSLGGWPGQTANQHELSRLQTTGSGISQIHSPWARIPLQIADAIGGGLFPGIEQRLPGTEGHHQVLLNEEQKAVTGEEQQRAAADKSALEAAQTTNQEAIPELKRTAADLAASRAAEAGTHNRATEDIAREKDLSAREIAEGKNKSAGDIAAEKNRAHVASLGFKQDETGRLIPLEYAEMSEPQQAIHDLKAAQSEQADATAALKKAQATSQPAMIALAQKRLESAAQAHSIAMERLGLSERQTEARLHGTEGGTPLPGAMINDAGDTVGTAFQGNIRPTGTQRDAAGRADTMLDLDTRIRKAMQNPEIQKGTGPLAGRLSEIQGRLGTLPHDLSELRNDLVSYGAFQAGLHPVRGIGALQYFDKVMGGLGQKPEELLGKLDSNKATAQSAKKVGSPKTVGSNQEKSGGPPTVKNQADYDALKSGAEYLDPDGNHRTKK